MSYWPFAAGCFALIGCSILLNRFLPSSVNTLLRKGLRTRRLWSILSQYGSLLALPGAIGLILLAGAFSFNLFQLPQNEVTLPLEVIGPDGHTASVQVNASNTQSVSQLYLKAHSIGYPYHLAEGRGYQVDKASVKINDGPWVDVNNTTASCLEPAASARCIDGPMHTIGFTIPISKFETLNEGANMIHFRFNYAHPRGELGDASTGYRILDIELQTSSGADRIDGTSFSWDDPGSWSAPQGFGSAGDVEDGKQLWHQRDLLIDGWNGPQITASCADCHVKNGYDLEYFAYSNKSIVQRSRFHGLSENQGKKIAAYIRSIQIETEDGRTIDPPGRPWNPPYQPGPTAAGSRSEFGPRKNGKSFSELNPVHWAAGAGSQWAMTYDRNIKSYVFPNGMSSNATKNLINEQINLREIPVALQMPDWNEWLPSVHPMDVWGSEFTNHEVWRWYTEEVPNLIQKAKNQNEPKKAANAAKYIWGNLMEGNKFRPSSAPAPYDDPTDLGVAKLARMQWGLTKTFEVLQPNHFENDAQEAYGSEAEPLQWLSDARVLFDQAPHIQGPVKGSTGGIMDRYHDAAWYQLQMVVNAGSGMTSGQKPMDWKYHYGHISAVNNPDHHSWQYVASYIKILQVAEGLPASHSEDQPEGWFLRHMTPGALDRTHHWATPLKSHNGRGLSDGEYRQVLNVLLRALGDGLTTEPLSEWSRQSGQFGIEPESFTPQMMHRYDCCTYANHFWSVLQRAGEAGVDYNVLRPLAQWAGNAWPKGDWMGQIEPYKGNPSFDETTNEQPDVGLRKPSGAHTVSPSESVTLKASASDPDGRIANVEFFAGDKSLGTSSSSPHTLTTNDISTGTHSLTASATDNEGATSVSDGLRIVVGGSSEDLEALPGVAREYYEGEWGHLPNFDSMSPVERDTSSNFSLGSSARSDNFGYRFASYVKITEEGEYTFHLASDDGSKMYVDGQLLIDNDGQHAARDASGKVTLGAGYHSIVVDYFEASKQQTLGVEWSPPSAGKSKIPNDRLYPERPRTQTEQVINLHAGWNLVSTRVEPTDASIRSVFGPTLNEVVLTKDEEGSLFSPRYDVTGLSTWKPKEGYQIYTSSDTSITIEGTALSPSAPIPLQKGWNFVSYLPSQQMPVEDAFSSLGDALRIAKNYGGDSYIPGRTDDITTATPTQGYKLYVSRADTLQYPSSPATKSSAAPNAARNGHPNTATVLIEAPQLPDGTPISAMADNQVVGKAVVQDGTVAITVRGMDQFSTMDTQRASDGARLTFVVDEGDSRSPLALRKATNFLTGRRITLPLTYSNDAVYDVTAAPSKKMYTLAKNIPNPVQDEATIRYTLPTTAEVTLSVYNVLGQQVKTLVDASKAPGQHRVQMDVSDMSSGVYFYRLNAGQYNKSRKMTVVK